MKTLERLYRSPVGRLMSIVANAVAQLHKPFMVYGYHDTANQKFYKYTRLSSTVTIMNRNALSIGDHVWIWHYSILDATEGLKIGDGCQIGVWVGIFTHGSESSIRLLGRRFVDIPNTQRGGYTRGRVEIGSYSFIGAGSIILPGVTIGKGCLIGANTLVTKDVPDYAILTGSPGVVRGSTLDLDVAFFRQQDYSATYYDAQALAEVLKRLVDQGSVDQGSGNLESVDQD